MKPRSFHPDFTTMRDLRAWLSTLKKAEGLAQLHGTNRLVTCSLGHEHCGCSMLTSMAGKAACSVEVKAEYERRLAPGVRYLTIIANWPADLVMLRVPTIGDDVAIKPWKKVLKAVNPIREAAGVAWKGVYSIEAVTGNDDPMFLQQMERAYQGATDTVLGFTLYAWDSETETFKLVRPAVKENP